MKVKIFKHTVALLLLAGCFYSCLDNNVICPSCCPDKEVHTAKFYVSGRDGMLFRDLGSPNHFHDNFVVATNLPKELEERATTPNILHVIVTYCYTGERYYPGEYHSGYPIINIIKIEEL